MDIRKVQAPLTHSIKKIGGALAHLYHSLFFPPAIIFIAIIVATVFGWQGAKVSLNHDILAAANAHANAAEQSLQQHLVADEQILRGGVGLFRGSMEVTKEEWHNYLGAFAIGKQPSGIQGVGFVQVFPGDQLPDVRDKMIEAGDANFRIWPEGPTRDTYAAVLYLENLASSAAPIYGFDMYSEPVRRASMFTARDSGNVTITPRIDLLSNEAPGSIVGFNMYAPYYDTAAPVTTVAERQAALRGYVYASFRANMFFSKVIGNSHPESIGYCVSANGYKPGLILYTSPSYRTISNMHGAVTVALPLKVYGQTWEVHFAFDPHILISDVQLGRPGNVLFFGAFSAVLIAIIVFLLLRARSRDLNAQQERAVELAKDELLSLASHQLRTPATGVKQYVGMVLQGFAGKVPVRQKKLLEKAYASNDRQLRIINEILHLAKIDSGRIVLAKQRTNLNELIRDVVNEQRPDIASANHTIAIDLPKQPVIVSVDMHMLRMAIENLLSNAIKYTPSGGQLAVRVYKHKLRALISITDSGIGIHPSDVHKIFRQFSRLDNEMSQQVGGTGIGLYLAKHLVELHGGTIKVTSSLGKGSTFTISLPAK